MVKKLTHPARELFDYIKGDVSEHTSRVIEEHLADCQDCSRVANLVYAIRKSEISNLKSQTLQDHPEVSELASFFYGKAQREKRAATAAHLALCQSCADQIAEYARAERAALEFEPGRMAESGVPAAAWKMIRDWEESSFATVKTDSEQNDQDMMARLTAVLSLRKDELRERARQIEDLAVKEDRVSVIIVDQTARFLGVEVFERVTSPEGGSLLKHADKSERFDNKPFHAVLDFGEESVVVVTDTIRRDSVRLQHITRPNTSLQQADYFIIENTHKEKS